MPYNQESLKNGFKQQIKRFALKYILFPRINYFLYIGSQNRLFYKSYNIEDERLIFCPYSVDNQRFEREYQALRPAIGTLKNHLGILNNNKIIIFSGKYIEKKRPLDILQAFANLNNSNLWLIMIGEGELRAEMEDFIKLRRLHNVILTGFINQSKIAEYYAIGDLFVMCSGLGETWGLSVNEAMNFNLPLVLSDLPGSTYDLVKPGINGCVFRTGDVNDLTQKLNEVLLQDKLTRTVSSADIVQEYSYEAVVRNLNVLVKDNEPKSVS